MTLLWPSWTAIRNHALLAIEYGLRSWSGERIMTVGSKTQNQEVANGHDGEELSVVAGDVRRVPIEEIDLENEALRFRLNLRTGEIVTSLQTQGMQVPVILLKKGSREDKYQLVSGFRRVHGARALGWHEVPGIIRDDLDEESAFKAAVVENTHRKTYSDIDRAMVILEYRQRGTGDDAVPIQALGLKKRRLRYLLSLLKLPESVQAAIDDPELYFSGSHGLTLNQLKGTYRKLDFERWIQEVNERKLSVTRLKRMVNKEHRASQKPGFTSLFQDRGTDMEAGEFRFSPCRVKVSELSEPERAALRAELENVLKALR